MFRRKERKAVSARIITCQSVPAASKAAVPASSRETYCTMQDIIASSRAASKSEAPRDPATVSDKSALKTTMPQEEESEDYLETRTWIENKALDIHIPHKSYVDARLQSVVSIFRVPNFLKELKMKAYVPQIVSLGPYHYNRVNLRPMDYHKRRALHRMMTRFNNSRRTIDPDNMDFSIRAIYKIFQDANKIKSCYDEKLDYEPDSLAAMLTLDGCFILEIFRTLGEDTSIGQGSGNYEPIFESTKIDFTGFDILNDILMLENQIPLIVLRELLVVESVDNPKQFLLDMLVKTPGTKFYPFDYEDGIGSWSWQQSHEQAHHLLGLLHSLIVSPTSDKVAIQIDKKDGKKKSRTDYRFIPPAVEISNAGIKFKRCNGGIEKIYFDRKKGTIYLPPINVTDHTEVLFRNLVALELCKPSEDKDNYVTCYLSLMNKLIDTEKDVALLRQSAVLKNYIGSDAEVAALFNGLCKGVTLPREDIFQQLQDDVMKQYKSKFKVWFAQFIKDYVSSPWKFLAFLGAILALVLTLLQTIYSILAYYNK